ncbi:MAG: hypothetical protein Q4C54_04330 [Clostridia bacterium]|nr:hypothetical protein [Clostridia bacterium]
MIRMEIALLLVLLFVAFNYFTAWKKQTPLHATFAVLLVTAIYHVALDGISVYTVARLDTIPLWINDLVHRFFIGTMILVVYLFYQYISTLVEDETGKPSPRLNAFARIYLMMA